MYAIEFLPSAARALSKLEASMQRRIARRVDHLAEDPRGGGALKLRGAEDVWRVRVGDYRILYELHDEQLLVLVIAVGHRREIYR